MRGWGQTRPVVREREGPWTVSPPRLALACLREENLNRKGAKGEELGRKVAGRMFGSLGVGIGIEQV